MPKLPELRKYEDNAEFMRDLQQSIPPREFREIDISTGQPRPRPVDIMLGDMRPQAYPAELVRRQNAMAAASSAPPPKKSNFTAFGGSGQTLGGSSTAEASSSAEASGATSAGGAGGAWPLAEQPAPTVDESAPTAEVMVRLA